MNKSETSMSFIESPSFEERVREALAQLSQTQASLVEIPDSNGMKLVRDNSPEAAERKAREGTVIATKKFEEADFLVCLN